MLWKYAANLQGNSHNEAWFQESSKATLLKSHFGMSGVLQIGCIFSEHVSEEHPWTASYDGST